MLAHNLDQAFWQSYLADDARFADVLVIGTAGSTYRKAGARMIVRADGLQWGMVAGGCFDALIRDEARMVLDHNEPRVFSVDTRAEDDALFGSGLGCQGRVDMWISPLPRALTQLQLEGYLGIGFQECDEVVLYALTSGPQLVKGERRSIGKNDAKFFLPSQTLLSSTLFHKSETAHGCDLFVEYRPATPRALIFGGGDDTLPLISLLHTMGWAISVIDNKGLNAKLTTLTTFFRFIQAHPDSFFADYNKRACDFLVAMTHRYELDLSILGHAVAREFDYVGFLGPKARGQRLLADLAKLNVQVPDAFYSRFYNPCGIDIQGRGPEAIALSIVTQMHAIWCKGSLKPLSDWHHER